MAQADFRRDALGLLDALDRLKAQRHSLVGEAWAAAVDRFLCRDVEEFAAKWQVAPPPTRALLWDPQATEKAAAVLTGRWALLPIFPQTTEAQALQAIRRARRNMGQKYAEAQNRRRVGLALWLMQQGFPRKDVFRAAWERKPPRTGRVSFKQEQAIMKELGERGGPYLEADRQVSRRLRKLTGAQRLQATMRTARKRYKQLLETEARDTDAPVNVDPISYAVTAILRDVFCEPFVGPAVLLARVTSLRNAIFPPSRA